MKIIGFRSGKVWRKILATIGYIMIIGVVITAFNGGDNGDNKSVQTLAPIVEEKEKVTNETKKVEETKIQKDKTEAEIVKEEIPITDSTNPQTNNIASKPVENSLPKESIAPSVPVDSKPIVTTVVKNEVKNEVSNELDVIVYRGNTGTKYHRSGCRTLKNGQIEMTLSEAKSNGLSACKVCNP